LDAHARSRLITCLTPSGRITGAGGAVPFSVARPPLLWPAGHGPCPDADRNSRDSKTAFSKGSVTPAGDFPAGPGHGQTTRRRIYGPFSVSKFRWSRVTSLRGTSRGGNVGRGAPSDATASRLSSVRRRARHEPTCELAPLYSPSRSLFTERIDNEPKAISCALNEESVGGRSA
jgi:hypothetical protein